MIKLAKREEQIMHVFWNLKKAFIRDIIPALPDPKPHYNTVATMVRVLEEKKFLGHETVGNMLHYFPIIQKEEYHEAAMKDIVGQYFDNSYPRMLAFFAKQQNFTEAEFEEMLNIIKSDKS